ncbi:hypothetical protein ACLMJK_000729 [Lecanora helva]
MPHTPFPAMGMDPRMRMEPPIEEFRGVNIQTVEPRFDAGNFDERPGRPARGPALRRTSTSNTKKPIYYEGYIFTRVKAEQPWQKPTWACIKRTTMPVSQGELRERAAPKASLFSRDKSVVEQYQSLADYQQRQVDRLINDRMRGDDADFEYILTSVKREERVLRGGKRQVTLVVIVKRQPRADVQLHPDMPVTPIPAPASEIIDLTGQEDSEKSSMNSYGGFSPPPHHAGPPPFDRHHSEPWGPRPNGIDDRFAPMPHRPPFGEEQPHGRPGMPFFAVPGEGFHEGHGAHEIHPAHGGHTSHDGKHKEEKKDKHEKGEKSPKRDKGEKHDKHEQHDKNDKKGKEHKRPEVHHSNSHKSDKKRHSHSDQFSSDSDWDHLSVHSRDTFDTLPTSSSSGSKYYKKEKKHDKEEKHKSSSHHNSRDRGAERPIYRQHTRKVPEKQREPSPTHSRQSGRSSDHYIPEEDVFVLPEVSHRGGRAPRREPRPRQVSYSRERPRRAHHRAMSFDDDLDFDLSFDEPAFVKKVTRVPRAPQVDYEKERLKLEVERERRDKEYLTEELDRTHAELKRASRMPPPSRERYQLPRARRPPPIIERETPLPRPRRVQEQYYDEYDDYDRGYY